MRRLANRLIITAIPCWIASAQVSSIPSQPKIVRHPAPPAPADVASPPVAAHQDAPGLWTLVLAAGLTEPPPKSADCVTYRFAAWRRDGSLYSTSGPDGSPATQCLNAMLPGVARALELMTTGEERRVWVSGLLSQPRKKAADADDDPVAGVPLTLDLKLVRILRSPNPPERLHPAEHAMRLPSGASMDFLVRGSGAVHPHPGGSVTVSYTSWDEAGKVVETTVMSGRPVKIPFDGSPIGWRDALTRMVAGDKIRLWVPASLVSGNRPALIYDLELNAVN